ncbi:hypothetical protein M011DRAFT_465520 [Sporormia fimetaria CBS 119925]|uniref:Uncharacterized protein n=1 Tax=Sporormia fimetaria CBS 119925 TaxID=1340428 RepID=A0A6A6VI92_9PLEO|nr:hypothetical protein M011DRAFT_465520 [Sporormia fimetaria CBS 119925]
MVQTISRAAAFSALFSLLSAQYASAQYASGQDYAEYIGYTASGSTAPQATASSGSYDYFYSGLYRRADDTTLSQDFQERWGPLASGSCAAFLVVVVAPFSGVLVQLFQFRSAIQFWSFIALFLGLLAVFTGAIAIGSPENWVRPAAHIYEPLLRAHIILGFVTLWLFAVNLSWYVLCGFPCWEKKDAPVQTGMRRRGWTVNAWLSWLVFVVGTVNVMVSVVGGFGGKRKPAVVGGLVTSLVWIVGAMSVLFFRNMWQRPKAVKEAKKEKEDDSDEEISLKEALRRFDKI